MRNSSGNGFALGKTDPTITAYSVMRVSANTVSETPMTSPVRLKAATTVMLSTLRNQAEFIRGCAGRVLRECSRCLVGVFAAREAVLSRSVEVNERNRLVSTTTVAQVGSEYPYRVRRSVPRLSVSLASSSTPGASRHSGVSRHFS